MKNHDVLPTLSGMTLQELQGVALDMGLPKFTGKQLAQWLYAKQVTAIDEMTNLSKEARTRLAGKFQLGRRPALRRWVSRDGTVKYLFPTQSGHQVESVFIPTEERGTLCVSSQVGCRMGCQFCMTGRQGLQAQLTAADILNQIYSLPEFSRLTNVVFMGQGEPFDNLDAVLRACEILTSPYGLAWSPKRITVSTVGHQKGLRRFLNESQCNVAISLHFAIPEERAQWMPAQKAWPIEKTVQMLKEYDFCREDEETGGHLGAKQRRLSFEYIVFKDLNDSRKHSDSIVRLLQGLDCRVNLIPFHSIPDSPFRAAPEVKMKMMRDYLTQHGLFSMLRASRGEDIMAACGLLSTLEDKA
ncbi:MAG: 23S rRNA (adenine(2503)-C(2))-methyltransferase RlmN [Bacteroidaceae bacterium]|nr:23S rRNA (adenine(2503)-C(2))-methyltransferase RlmN [Bacteroidaceae bacterium]